MKDRPKIGLALGAGGSRGLAHIGVLQVLEENDIPVDIITGSSIGSLIGSLYAVGISPNMMEGIALNLDKKNYYDVSVPRTGFIKGEKIEELMKLLTKGQNFEDVDFPLGILAVDIKNNELLTIKSGPIYKAVRASISIPGVFMPVIDGDRVLVDGGVLERLPVKAARDMGADIVLAVDVGYRGQIKSPKSILEIIFRSIDIMGYALVREKQDEGDVEMYPDNLWMNPMDFNNVAEAIKEGRDVALKHLDEIKNILSSFKNQS